MGLLLAKSSKTIFKNYNIQLGSLRTTRFAHLKLHKCEKLKMPVSEMQQNCSSISGGCRQLIAKCIHQNKTTAKTEIMQKHNNEHFASSSYGSRSDRQFHSLCTANRPPPVFITTMEAGRQPLNDKDLYATLRFHLVGRS